MLVSCLFLFSFFQSAAPTLVHKPSLSPDGKTIAFSFQGDIWTMVPGQHPIRLTIHESYESLPVWSPDGKWIAFSGDRYGQYDVFVVPAQGGPVKRLTYHPAADLVTDWNQDGIFFETRRQWIGVEWEQELYSVSPDGGTPVRLMDTFGFQPSLSPDGRFIAYVGGSCRIAREQYEGPANRNIWVYDRESKQHRRVTPAETNDFEPHWSGNELFFIGVENGRYNLQSATIQVDQISEIKTHTHFTAAGIQSMDVSGDQIVMEQNGTLLTFSVGGQPTVLALDLQADSRHNPDDLEIENKSIESYALSPNKKWLALIIEGDVFVKENDEKKSRTVNLTQSPAREREVLWLDDQTLAYTSDAAGNYDLYQVTSSDANKKDLFSSLKHQTKALTQTAEDEHNLVRSSDGKKVVGVVGAGTLAVYTWDPKTGLSQPKTLLSGWASPEGLAISPDSQWLAYALYDLNFNSEIFILPLSGDGQPVNVSMHPRRDSAPFWSQDGTKLGFSSIRNGGNADVWFAWLTREDWEKTKQDQEEGWYFDTPADEPKDKDKDDDSAEGDTKKDKKKKEVKPVRIDFEGIWDRLVQVSFDAGDEIGVGTSEDGKTFYFVGDALKEEGTDLYSTPWDKRDVEALTQGGQNPDQVEITGKDKFLFLKKGGLTQLEKGKTKGMPHQAHLFVDKPAQYRQIFEEAWRAIQQGFYDPEFHGRDWQAIKTTYEPLCLAEQTDIDFSNMFNLMLGQLDASHMGMYHRPPSRQADEKTGLLGTEGRGTEKGYQISYVVPHAPADKEKSQLNPGDTIVSINGQAFGPKDNLYAHLRGQEGQLVLLEVVNEKQQKREVAIRPEGNLNNEQYEAWVAERKRLTDTYSQGQLGYLHIRGMNMPSFERFERDLMASGYGKKGLVIDVRFNGGGWTTDYLMAVLNVRQHAYTIPRGATDSLKNHAQFANSYPFSERLPLSSWTQPSIALCNQNSYSNAEIFSHAYKSLGIGTLVGMPTFGAVISTGAYGLQSHFLVRMPFRAWFVKETASNMEHGPAVPDILIENERESRAKNEDPQLQKAVQTLLEQINTQP
ncbi:MAG: PD40 domain-containing protein [Acidobacteria bacterium]|nr:PD40 domain-containing protein [Acidobacteriota bacterium]MCB9399268.1 PD40 domain-containing protein [Acidobacteriota bacterium]